MDSMSSTQALVQGEALSPELKRKASILGWCIEWVRPNVSISQSL